MLCPHRWTLPPGGLILLGAMWYQQQSDDYRPLFWISGRAVYANTLLVALHVISFVACAIVVSFLTLPVVFNALSLEPSLVWHGKVTRLLNHVI